MRKIINKYVLIESLLIIILIISTLLNFNSKVNISIIMLVFTIITCLFIKKKLLIDIVNLKRINIIMLIFGILYVSLFYMVGLYTRFYRNTYNIGFNSLINNILPISIIIVCTEILRFKLLNDSSIRNKILVTIIGIIPDFCIFSNMYTSTDLDKFLVIIGFILFSAISNSLLYTYISSRYGKEPIIIYRLIINLYMYIIPILPNVYIFFRTFVRIFYPLLIFYYLDKYYNSDNKVEKIKDRRFEVLSLSFCTFLMILLIALVSCRFTYGALVIGSTSMAGTIDKGDIIIYKVDKNILNNDVIVFKKGNVRVVHRVIKVEDKNIETRYYTKGDANDIKDKDYIVNSDIIGRVVFSVKYLGRPTLWLRDLFNKEG